jgi:hypothetical protein
MGITILTTQEIFDRNLSNFESKLNQTSPLVDVAFLRVMAATLATNYKELQIFAVDKAKQNLALTAGEEGLTLLGNEYNVPRDPAIPCRLELTVDITTTPATIPTNINWIGDLNGISYKPDEETNWTSSPATFDVTALVPGEDSTLGIGATLTVENPIAGVQTQATVSAVTNVGLDQQSLESWAEDILSVERNSPDGGNAFDYRRWAEEVPEVETAYPYSGQPDPLLSLPGDRTVYIQVKEEIDSDGWADQAILDKVRQNINFDPLTGYARPALGDTDSNLWVESIERIGIYVEVRDLIVAADKLAATKEAIDSSLDKYLRGIQPYVDGLDALSERNDTITATSLSEKVQDAVKGFGGTVGSVGFGLSPGTFISIYTLAPGELGDKGGVVYV